MRHHLHLPFCLTGFPPLFGEVFPCMSSPVGHARVRAPSGVAAASDQGQLRRAHWIVSEVQCHEGRVVHQLLIMYPVDGHQCQRLRKTSRHDPGFLASIAPRGLLLIQPLVGSVSPRWSVIPPEPFRKDWDYQLRRSLGPREWHFPSGCRSNPWL